ncbi:hypothetical protein [Nordella sp. HKS 07]|nr:hypothetical protein [Nordella sp. HKS 07]
MGAAVGLGLALARRTAAFSGDPDNGYAYRAPGGVPPISDLP